MPLCESQKSYQSDILYEFELLEKAEVTFFQWIISGACYESIFSEVGFHWPAQDERQRDLCR